MTTETLAKIESEARAFRCGEYVCGEFWAPSREDGYFQAVFTDEGGSRTFSVCSLLPYGGDVRQTGVNWPSIGETEPTKAAAFGDALAAVARLAERLHAMACEEAKQS